MTEIRKCERCGLTKEIIGVFSSSLGPISLATCESCGVKGAEPSWLVKGIVEMHEEDSFVPEFYEALTYHHGQYITIRSYIDSLKATE